MIVMINELYVCNNDLKKMSYAAFKQSCSSGINTKLTKVRCVANIAASGKTYYAKVYTACNPIFIFYYQNVSQSQTLSLSYCNPLILLLHTFSNRL